VTDEVHPVAGTPTARRALTRLPEKAATAAVEFIYGPLAENPQRVGKPLRFELEGLHSARRGDFRIIHRIADVVTVVCRGPAACCVSKSRVEC
jgi:mRNA-degrading endonuclease RelE of RelBE toxin-antitoxin system